MRISDWSSDVCSSDLAASSTSERSRAPPKRAQKKLPTAPASPARPSASAPGEARSIRTPWGVTARVQRDRKRVVEGKSLSVSVQLGGRRIIKKKTNYLH